ncbi:ComEA family DNA-binding protein [Streptomyces koyangensis]|uniref:ComEA family DNA-binding protein n=1 Tax=Streptomyces koyangensis TaxID=188770 RepID=A0ABX7ECC8_9ACTN|nr:ComEA family DNA-binding protein [Streptomyces koyangensis]QRF02181.1 ComEA family DNA-binding protein [Streptomyces koyangensis]
MVLRSSFFGVGVRDGQGRGGERAGEGAGDAVRARAEALLGAGGPAGEQPEGATRDRAAEAAAWDDDRRIVGHPWWGTESGELGARDGVTDGRVGAADRGAGREGGASRPAEEAPSGPDERPPVPGETGVPRERPTAGEAPRPRRAARRGWGGVPVLLRARCGMEWRSVAALVVVVVVAVGWAAQHFWTGRPEAVRVPEAVAQGASEAPGAVGAPAATGLPSPSTGAEPSPSAGPLVVDVSGKVARPGVHRLPAGSRVEDALEAAGGVRPGTDTSGLNRARLLTDGEQVAVGVDPAPGAGPAPGAPGSGAGVAAAGPLSLGTATAEQLETLPGVGPVLAAAIIAYRTENGGFRSVDQLRDVRGIGDRRFEDLRELVRP